DPARGVAPVDLLREPPQRGTRVGDDPEVDRRAVAADLARLDVDLDEVVEMPEAAVAEEVVELLADDEEDVGLVDDVLPVVAEAQRMVVGDEPARGLAGDERDPAPLDEGAQLVARVRPPDTAARHDGRPARAREQLDGASDRPVVGPAAAGAG